MNQPLTPTTPSPATLQAIATWLAYGTAASALAAVLALALLVPDTRPWLLWGGLGWGLGIVAKGYVAYTLWARMERLGAIGKSVAHGLLSGAAELGVVAGLFWVSGLPGSLWAALALGIGATITEIGFLLISDRLEESPDKPLTALSVAFAFPVERLLVASPLHIGSRALVAASFLTAAPGWAGLALVCFALTDGLPTFVEAKQGDWTSPRTLYRYYAGAGLVAWVALAGGLVALAP